MDEQKPLTVFELCRELNLNGFPQKKNDSGWYFVTPEVMIMMRDIDELKLIDGRTTIDFDKLIYYPKEADLREYLGTDFQQLTQTNGSGWFAYANSTHGLGITTRSGGETAWLAMANVVYARFLEKNQVFPPMDVSESENVQEAQSLPDVVEKQV